MTTKGRAVVVGSGITGVAVRKHLEELGYAVDVIDDSAGPVPAAEVEEILTGAQLLYPSAGVMPTHPAWAAAQRHDIPIVGELDLAQQVSDLPIVAVTASNGKTTITTLVDSMLRASGLKSVAAGNIGYPLIEAVKTDAAIVVAEVSSFQLHACRSFRPPVALWANASPNHLDWHGTFDDYVAAKARIWTNQTSDDYAIANIADPVVMKLASETRGQLVTFGPGGDFRQEDGALVMSSAGIPSRRVIGVDDLPRSLPHDIDNALAALATAHCAGADLEASAQALRDFGGLPHRVELVGEAGGVRWFNDSKATTPESVVAALSGFDSVVLIAGGRNKGVDLSILGRAADRVRAVVAIGEAVAEIDAAFSPGTAVAKAESMDDAVTRAACLARSGDVVILSPGCASYDWYGSYVERGADFTRAVHEVLARTPASEKGPDGAS
ncbi:MAG: UDP-N-acetylmuramoyl-L-alanine--D-glutamate ligase [Actinobacteria bacterium]|nr:UDP-N-acetylmuramoyl-L-alanine--D-glutamate ligase [Actinomycetota bacterium]